MTKLKFIISVAVASGLVVGALFPPVKNLQAQTSAEALVFPVMQIVAPQSSVASRPALYPRGFVYPVKELGNCTSKQDCFTYCEQPSNMTACAYFSEANGFMKLGSARIVEKYATAIMYGSAPGNCGTGESCKQYCGQETNRNTCTVFVNNLVQQSRVLGATDTYGVPSTGLLPYCDSETSCQSYCASNPGNTACTSLLAQGNTSKNYITPEILNLINTSQTWAANTNGVTNSEAGSVKAAENFNLSGLENQLRNCLNGAEGLISTLPLPPTGFGLAPADPASMSNYSSAANACEQQFNNQIPTIDDAIAGGTAQAVDSIGGLQACLSRSRNLAADIQNCIRGNYLAE